MSRSLRRFLRDNGLGLAFLALFVLAVIGQAFAGHADFNNQLAADDLQQITIGDYVTSSDFAVDVTENWQSEYLQFFLYIFLTVWLVQRGSPESKSLHKIGVESDKEQRVGPHANADSPRWAAAGGLRLKLYASSLGYVMGAVFVLSWLAQSIAGVAAYNEDQLRQLQAPMSWPEYIVSADFWSRTLQNWQSEFLAIASMAILSIYLRQRGSPESKPVGAAHTATGVEG
ncbi:hypothetical protein Sipo8835_13265 [Streptomyces ipomoeae]|uniref:Tat pathway signal sequence domain protein n=2 Tax=Streptomyces ipomoeae TaxID=103232 RepID=L1KPR3_9ACTN|nr:DUF6766 family protein [Streptomyces ipomoeae]EKX62348.1 Tat pathway signal sequence domain protein [Streptomyces ipomoeae 91-03]MDX2696637.1 hypothetical protein [Streptomyces ipomoeae]MDX2823922.1 hypothetical protein [Streptomyces ipomoeae]MDX2842432.1 hypothetical protein [Streptomyces ipomoeae]MDX2878155.1 hypothetical protein [Streptomyces ipomoeae]